jgi:LysM repeat protein
VKVSKKKSSGKDVRYTVKRGDSLWKISGKSTTYNDSFKWPLIYKANKSVIEDPDLIYPRQKFEIKQNFSDEEIEDAVAKAKETEPYEPHTEPRKSLPIKY